MIAFVVNGPVGSRGGVETFNYYLIKDLLAADVDIYTTANLSKDINNLEVKSINKWAIPVLKKKYEKIFVLSSLYHGVIPSFLKKEKIYHIQILHGFRPFIFNWSFKNKLSDPIKALLSYLTIISASKRSDWVISNSFITKAFYERMFSMSSIPIPLFFKSFIEAFPSLKNNNCCYDLLFVGKFNRVKNIIYFLDVIELLEKRYGFRLNICLIGDGPLREYVHEKVSSLKSSIKIYPYLPNQAVKQIMLKSKILIVPSLIETFGLVVAEGLASGMFVFASKYCGIADYISEEKLENFRIISWHLENTVDKIAKYLELEPDREKHAAAFSEVVKRFSFVYNLLSLLGLE